MVPDILRKEDNPSKYNTMKGVILPGKGDPGWGTNNKRIEKGLKYLLLPLERAKAYLAFFGRPDIMVLLREDLNLCGSQENI